MSASLAQPKWMTVIIHNAGKRQILQNLDQVPS